MIFLPPDFFSFDQEFSFLKMFASKLWRTQSSKIRYVCYNAPSNSHAGQPVFDWKITPPLRQLFVQIDELQAFTARNWNLTETLPTWMRLQLTYSTLALEGMNQFTFFLCLFFERLNSYTQRYCRS